MNNQEFFTKTLNHLRKQGVPAMGPGEYDNPQCMYRGENGTSCAIGCHIPDDKYKSSMENLRVKALLQKFPDLQPIFEGVNSELMADMQFLHDNCFEDLADLEKQATVIARIHNLEYTAP